MLGEAATWTSSDAPRPRLVRDALRAFATGVTVVTSGGADSPCGVTANAFTSVSLTPPLVLVCLRRASSSMRTIADAGVFAVNVLSARQEYLARWFADPDRPRGHAGFRGVRHRREVTGAPILDDVAGWIDCRLADLSAAGDHLLLFGEVVAVDADQDADPLVFHAGRYRAVSDEHPPLAPWAATRRIEGGESL